MFSVDNEVYTSGKAFSIFFDYILVFLPEIETTANLHRLDMHSVNRRSVEALRPLAYAVPDFIPSSSVGRPLLSNPLRGRYPQLQGRTL